MYALWYGGHGSPWAVGMSAVDTVPRIPWVSDFLQACVRITLSNASIERFVG